MRNSLIVVQLYLFRIVYFYCIIKFKCTVHMNSVIKFKDQAMLIAACGCRWLYLSATLISASFIDPLSHRELRASSVWRHVLRSTIPSGRARGTWRSLFRTRWASSTNGSHPVYAVVRSIERTSSSKQKCLIAALSHIQSRACALFRCTWLPVQTATPELLPTYPNNRCDKIRSLYNSNNFNV